MTFAPNCGIRTSWQALHFPSEQKASYQICLWRIIAIVSKTHSGFEEISWNIGANPLTKTVFGSPTALFISLKNAAKVADSVLNSAQERCLLCRGEPIQRAIIHPKSLIARYVPTADYVLCSAPILLFMLKAAIYPPTTTGRPNNGIELKWWATRVF